MDTLIFQLQAPLSSWGEVAVGEYRPSADYPSQSALHGLLGAALGIDRGDDIRQAQLRAGYRLAIGVLSPGRLLRDFHTAQVPSRADLKKRPHATRRDELSLPKQDLNTILSSRDYRQNASCLVALQAGSAAPHSLSELAAALKVPRFVLYLGRKSCPLAVPLHPCIVAAETVNAAFANYQQQLEQLWRQALPHQAPQQRFPVQKIAWGDDFGDDDIAAIGVRRHLSIVRKDQVISRHGWQFTDRNEHICMPEKE